MVVRDSEIQDLPAGTHHSGSPIDARGKYRMRGVHVVQEGGWLNIHDTAQQPFTPIFSTTMSAPLQKVTDTNCEDILTNFLLTQLHEGQEVKGKVTAPDDVCVVAHVTCDLDVDQTTWFLRKKTSQRMTTFRYWS
ncbi:hypothetical protein BaRGS_00008916 [Batillaria attramentaria]|uniref:Uncharacterized protein n=1 Tax=Batillaria attramentaria TaxID=370345 RepID=A0ABD0LK46_9CAEN